MRSFVFLLSLFLAISLSSCATRVVTRPAAHVTVVKTLPKHHKVVYVKGKRYYSVNGRHYRKTNRGFIVVRI